MIKPLLSITFFAIFLYGCSSEISHTPTEKPDLEMEVINDILPELIPEHPPCMPVPIEGETHEEYDLRLEEFYREVDSKGKKLEIMNRWGNLIFSAAPYQNNFDAQGLTDGVYHYIFYPDTSTNEEIQTQFLYILND